MGCGLLFDPLLDYHLLTISSSARTKFTELAPPTLASISTPIKLPSPIPRRNTKPPSYLSNPFPDDSPLHLTRKSILSDLRIPPNLLREKDPLSTEALKALGDVTVRIRDSVSSLLRVGELFRRRYFLLLSF